MVDKIIGHGSNIQVERLQRSIEFELAVSTTTKKSLDKATAKTKLTILIHLPGTDIPVRIRNM